MTDLGNSSNPLVMLKSICTVDDFCSIKIDIDNTAVELEFIRQIVSDPELYTLIDELFFEHHTCNPYLWLWWGCEHGFCDHSLGDSYDLFLHLRKLGIRAHSWI